MSATGFDGGSDVASLHTTAKLAGDHGGMDCGTNEIMTGLAAKTLGYTR